MDLLRDSRMRPLIIVVVLFLVILVGAWIFSSLGGATSSLGYVELENKIANAAEEYFEDNEGKLPETLDEEVEVDVDTLISEEYMKSIDEYLKDEDSCSGKAIVRYTNLGYVYKGYLDCGNSYTTELFKDVLTKDVVTSGDGLYKLTQYNGDGQGEAHVFRGEIVKNYVKIGEDVWNVVKVDSSGDIMIISTNNKEAYVWDDRYNIQTDDNRGINDFSVSRIKDTLSKMADSVDQYVELKKMITAKTICIGTRGKSTIGNSGSVECSKTLDGQYFSLLPVYDFMTVSLDENCSTTMELSCSNYNYLNANTYPWWTLTGNSEKTNQVYYYDPSYAGLSYANSSRRLRIVAYLDSTTVYVSGTGTAEDPYIVK